MNYPIPANPEEVMALQQKSVDEEIVAAAIAGVIQISRSEGKSLEQLTAEVLADDSLLDLQQRRWLKEIVAQAWESIA
ncbi:hypothetical protein ACE1B6_23245 [Aerosakkonemataceae cyanobacterium BLCC-F154]|uniref:Uncharacterized protein n=1 Tax=Floridaenema fluviatile BLCC-F154 TaxID=3153640 RepID=A0ABV4YJA6_9CYAN